MSCSKEIQAQYENRQSTELHLAEEHESLQVAVQRASSTFVNQVMGLAHKSYLADYTEIRDDFPWGETLFSVFHACLEVCWRII